MALIFIALYTRRALVRIILPDDSVIDFEPQADSWVYVNL